MPSINFQKKISEFTVRDVATHLFTFCLYYIGAALGMYIFFDLHSLPTLIWPPVGIALSAVFLGGYTMLIPIFLAQVLALVGTPVTIFTIFITASSIVLQTFVGIYFLRRFNFNPSFSRAQDAGIFILVAICTTVVGPAINTIAQVLTHTTSSTIFLTVSRAWVGGIFSAVILMPFFTSWYLGDTLQYKHFKKVEIFLAFILLFFTDIVVFWTSYAADIGISVIFVIPIVLIWFVFRFHPRWLTLAFMLTTVVEVMGSIIAHPTRTPINIQLLSDEIYIGFLAALFLLFVVLVEERRLAFKEIEHKNDVLADALERISADDTAKTEFLAILAHELRNPLSPIVSALEWLVLQPQTDESLVAIMSAQKHAIMLQRLLDDLLDVVRVTQKKFRLNLELINIKDIVSQSVESAANFLQERKHGLKVVHENEEAAIYADPIRMKQILINILNNAGKYMDVGGKIELTTIREGNFIVFRITDTGVGISSELLPNIFDPFRRVSPSSKSSTGLGIGLSLTKQLVEMHGGSIEAHSEGEGKGSSFAVYMPLPTLPTPEVVPVEPPLEYTFKKHILIIDDNEAAVLGLKKLLEYHHQVVYTALTGENGISAAKNHSPEVILLDIGLPDIDGYDVARQLRREGYTGALIALTGFGQKGDQEESKKAGFDFHLVKPVSIGDILKAIAEIPSSS